MLSTLLTAALILVTPAEDMTLLASVETKGGLQYEFSSNHVKDNGQRPKYTITNTISNYREIPFRFDLDQDQKVWVATTVKKGNATVPKSITTVRTTYRRMAQLECGVSVATTSGEETSAFPAVQWFESNTAAIKAQPGDKLEAKLVDGGANGKALVRCISEVTGDKEKGYTYTLTIENLSTEAVSFKWAGLKGKIEPKKSFTHSESATTLTNEQSGLATLDFGNKREFGIRANFWDRPK